MSGGSYNYEYLRVHDEYVGSMYDLELDEMMKDLVDVLHDLEWWRSCDISEKTYRDSVHSFKEKWIGNNEDREKLLKELIDIKLKKIQKELYGYVGISTEKEE